MFFETGFAIYHSSSENPMATIEDRKVSAILAKIRDSQAPSISPIKSLQKNSQPLNAPSRKQVLNEPVQNQTTTCLRQNQLPIVLRGTKQRRDAFVRTNFQGSCPIHPNRYDSSKAVCESFYRKSIRG